MVHATWIASAGLSILPDAVFRNQGGEDSRPCDEQTGNHRETGGCTIEKKTSVDEARVVPWVSALE